MNQSSINNSILPYVSAVSTKPRVGEIHLDIMNNVMHVYDGSVWVSSTGSHYSLKKQQSIESLCEIHPGLAELKKELDEAQQRFDAYLALIRE